MRNWKKYAGIGLVIGALLVGSTTAANTPGIPGSVEDPLITKSYLDEQIQQLKAQIRKEVEEELKKELQKSINSGGRGTGGSSAPLVVEALSTGQTLIAEAGTEVIVRTGHVVGIVGPGGDGIPDVTQGIDIRGTQIKHNHLLLFPRSDGRGIKVIQGPSYVMIRGGYEIK